MSEVLAWCGAPPLPWELWGRWTLDPWLFAGLAATAVVLMRATRDTPAGQRAMGWAGLGVTAAVFVSPLCALAVALFSARSVQHMLLVLVAAPLLAMALPPPARRGAALLTAAFTGLFWLWHLPGPYDAALRDGGLYWLSHLSLLGVAVALWRVLLANASPGSLALGAVASAQMGLLGAVLVFAPAALYASHLGTTTVFGLSALADQQLGGLLMWVPGGLVFLLVGIAGALRLARPTA